MKSVMIVENDMVLAALLEQMVLNMEYQCSVANTLVDAYYLLERSKPDLILLDRLLPDGDGLELAQHVHDSYFTIRVLCISTLGATKERIHGLEIGIDDYLPKPFSTKELELRLRRLLFSEKVLESGSISISPLLRFFPESGVVVFERTAMQLRKKESAILHCLCRHKNQVVSREQIVAYVWQGQATQPTVSTLDVYIRRIRGKLGKHAKCIQTARGFGYSITIL